MLHNLTRRTYQTYFRDTTLARTYLVSLYPAWDEKDLQEHIDQTDQPGSPAGHFLPSSQVLWDEKDPRSNGRAYTLSRVSVAQIFFLFPSTFVTLPD
jgi:hypothetical protein